ncbi:response regulator receiver domain [Xanthobacter sediminis]
MSDVHPDLLREAFVEPIRFALLIDDEFPAYRALAEGSKGAAERAAGSEVLGLLDLCRGRGWLCDVESDLEAIRNAGQHLAQSDLAIVDFHLDGAKDEDSTAAIRLLQQLAATPHFNLAVVYTRTTLVDAALDVAFSLGAGRIPTSGPLTKGETQLETLEDEGVEVRPDLSVMAALAAEQWNAPAVAALKARWREKLDEEPTPALKVQFARYFEGRISEEIRQSRKVDKSVTFDLGGPVPWVSADNLFVAFVAKAEPANVLVERLCQALEAWNPPALKVLLVQARAELEKAGSKHDLGVLRSELRQAGWLYNVLAADLGERRKQIGELYGHLFEGLATQLQATVGEFGGRLLTAQKGETPIGAARRWARLPDTAADGHVVHAANEFLSSTDCERDGRLMTGLVFGVKSNQGSRQLWVCVTPSCDLVPGQNDAGWDADMKPFKAVYAARLTAVPAAEFDLRLREASRGRHLFLTYKDEPLALEVAAANSRQARLEVLFVAHDGRIVNGEFEGFVLNAKSGVPKLEAKTFKTVAQLRPGYANKFLMDAGMQKARIGLSWAAALPEPPSAQLSGDAAPEAASAIEPDAESASEA